MSRFELSAQSDSEDNTGGGDHFPSRLKERDQWFLVHETPWNDDLHHSPKYPVHWNDDGDLLPFTEARQRFEQEEHSTLAFRFTDAGPFIGLDLDDVKEDGEFTNEALGIVQRLDSYTEVSSSGTGLHVIAEGGHLNGHKNRGDLEEGIDDSHIEVYDTDRYFALTGDVYKDFTSVEGRPTVVREVQDDHLPERQKFSFTGQQKPASEQEFDGGETDVTPEQVRRTIRAYVKTDSHDVDQEVLRLWRGSDEGRPSASEADMAFVKQLYYWCKGDQQFMDECFRASRRMRPKWDEVHSSDGGTYREMTMRKICRTNSDTFGGRYVERG